MHASGIGWVVTTTRQDFFFWGGGGVILDVMSPENPLEFSSWEWQVQLTHVASGLFLSNLTSSVGLVSLTRCRRFSSHACGWSNREL